MTGTLLVDGRAVGPVALADSYLRRLRGLLGQVRIDVPLVLTPCSSVHGVGMVVPLDVAQLDAEWRVVRVATLWPFGLVLPRRGVRHVLEGRHGAFAEWGLTAGSRLAISNSRTGPAEA